MEPDYRVIHPLIADIARALGWQQSPKHDVWDAGGCLVYDAESDSGDDQLIVLAAYAKAEMAKRGVGYEQCASVSPRAATVGWGPFDEPRWNGNQHEYDPTDPITEAVAVLRCIADALQSNTPDEKTASLTGLGRQGTCTRCATTK